MENLLLELAKNGQVYNLRLLLDHYRNNVNCLSPEGNTPLILASFNGHVEIVNLLLQHNANIENVNMYGKTALMMAAQEGHVNVARVLLEKQKYTIDYYNQNYESALTEACYGGHIEMVYLLLGYRHETGFVPYELHSAMLKAIMANKIEIVRILIAISSPVNKHPDIDESPLTMAVVTSSVDMLELLIINGANIEEINSHGNTPLQVAVKNDKKEMVIALLANGADIEVITLAKRLHNPINLIRVVSPPDSLYINDGYSILMVAAKGGYCDIGEILINNGANVNTIALIRSHSHSSSCTALKIAAKKDHLQFVNLLLWSQNINVNPIDTLGRIPLWYAARNGHLAIVKSLCEHGANINHRVYFSGNPEIMGGTSVMVAIQYGRLNVVSWLVKLQYVLLPNNDEMATIFAALPQDNTDVLRQKIYVKCLKKVFTYRNRQLYGHI